MGELKDYRVRFVYLHTVLRRGNGSKEEFFYQPECINISKMKGVVV